MRSRLRMAGLIAAALLTASGAAVYAQQGLDHRDRRNRRRLLSARRRLRQHPRQGIPGVFGDGAGHRRLGRQPAAGRLGQGRHGFSQVDAAWDAINGKDKFPSGKLPIRALVVMYPNHMHVVTVEGTGIEQDRGHQGQARLHRLAGQRDRGLRHPRARGRRPRSREGHQARSVSASPRASTPSRTRRSTRSSGSAACRPRR